MVDCFSAKMDVDALKNKDTNDSDQDNYIYHMSEYKYVYLC